MGGRFVEEGRHESVVRRRTFKKNERASTFLIRPQAIWELNLIGKFILPTSHQQQQQQQLEQDGRGRDDEAPPPAKLYPNKVKNMQRNPFRMSLFETPPYLVNYRKSDAEDDQTWIGYDGGMVEAIAKHFNATPQLVVPVNSDPGWVEEMGKNMQTTLNTEFTISSDFQQSSSCRRPRLNNKIIE